MLPHRPLPISSSPQISPIRSGNCGLASDWMKIFIEVELAPDEIPLASELFRTLRLLTDHVKTRDVGKLFRVLISRLDDTSKLDSVAAEISNILESGMTDHLLNELFVAFASVVFDHELVSRQQSVVPFMYLMPRLPEPARSKMREFLIPMVLKHLTVKRPVDTRRMDFFAHAEAFAAFVNMEFVSITGAVTTILTLLQKPENRCAAITMLGKTVEICLQQLTEKCEPSVLDQLKIALHSVTEDSFQYDINYIEDSLGWSRQESAGIAQHEVAGISSVLSQVDLKSGLSDHVSPSMGLKACESYVGHRSTIYAMSYDEKRNQLVTGGKEGTLILWTTDGQVSETVDLTRHYACSMDIHSSHQSLLVCGVAKEEAMGQQRLLPTPCILRYDLSGRDFSEQGLMSKESAKLISTIKVMGGVEHAFVTGETHHTAGRESSGQRISERVCYYDIQASTSFSTLQPLIQYGDHEDLITCLSLFPPNHNLFMSGSRDSTVRVWDRRTNRCVGMFGAFGKSGRVQAHHDSMITSLDARDMNMILSTAMDKRVLRWDFRALANQGGSNPVSTLQLDDSAVLKVALGGGVGKGAVSTLRGLYYVDFSASTQISSIAEAFPDNRRVGTYHDLKWAAGRNILFAAGEDMRVDCYSLHQ